MTGINRQLGEYIIPTTCYQNQKNPLSLCLVSCWDVCSARLHLFTLHFFVLLEHGFLTVNHMFQRKSIIWHVFFLQFGYHVAQPHFGFFSWIWIGYLNCTELAARSLVLNLSFLGEDGSKFLWTLKLCHAMWSCGGLNGLHVHVTCIPFILKWTGFVIPIVFLQKLDICKGVWYILISPW